jgi:transglutaminase-like putative cysteine protease
VGFSNEVNLGATGALASDPTPVMRVEPMEGESLAGLHWRGVALYRFDGERWSAPRPGARVLTSRGHGMHLGHERRVDEGRRLRYRVALEPLATDALFFAGQPELVQGRFSRLVYTETDDLHVPDAPAQGVRYEALTWLPDLERLQPSDVVELFGDEFRHRYLQLPGLDPRVRQLTEQITAGVRAPLRRARVIELYLKTKYGYALELPSVKSPDPLAHFLFERKEGHCEYFASAMALMLRLEGIPSRIVNGFYGGVWNDLTGMQVLRSADAHSWVEAYIPGYGWLEFDPTPPAPPGATGLFANLWMYWDAVESAWTEWIVGYDSSRQRELARSFQENSTETAVDVILKWEEIKRSVTAFLDRVAAAAGAGANAAGRAMVAGAILMIVGAALMWGAPALRAWWRRRRVASGRGAASDCRYFYERALRTLARRGYVRRQTQTAEEFLSTIPDTSLRNMLGAVIDSYNAARFGGDAAAERRLPDLVGELERVKA